MNALNAVVFVSSDEECKRILLENGLIAEMVPPPGCNHIVKLFKARDYYCMATRDTGHANGDNGYTITMLPKTVVSEDDALQFFNGVIGDLAESKGVNYRQRERGYNPQLN